DWWWRRRAGRSVAAAGDVVGSMTAEEPAEASHTQAVQTQDPLTPSVGSVAVGGAANKRCIKEGERCSFKWPWQDTECCHGHYCDQDRWPLKRHCRRGCLFACR
ncbi:unnamed protein product, partial [Polarella glacialis]